MTPEELERSKELLRRDVASYQREIDATRVLINLERQASTGWKVLKDQFDDDALALLDQLELLKNERKRLWLEIIMDDYT